MKILIRLPNWLGDMVMAAGFVEAVQRQYPEAAISLIAKKGIHELLRFFPATAASVIFDKKDAKGLRGLWNFGRGLKKTGPFELFFSLPDSFSSALIGFASGSKERIGYKKDGRAILLTTAYPKPAGLHRVQEYAKLLEGYTGIPAPIAGIRLQHPFAKGDFIAVNINSEASSRRLTPSKAVEIISGLRASVGERLILIGAPKERAFVQEVMDRLPDKTGIDNRAGQTDMQGLVQTLASAKLLLTTDSGPAHLANALSTQTVVLFGAGNEAVTAPYNKEWVTVIRLGELSCEPCEKNICTRFGTPQCLERLNTDLIINTVKEQLAL